MRRLFETVAFSLHAPRRSCRRPARRPESTGLGHPERLEPKALLAVDVTLSGTTLTLSYGAAGDTATLAVDANLNYTVTGGSGTAVSGSTSGAFSSVFSIQVVDPTNAAGQSFTLTAASFLTVLGNFGIDGVETVAVSAPTLNPMAMTSIVATNVTISAPIEGPGTSLGIVASGTVSLASVGEYYGPITIECGAFTMSGSLSNSGAGSWSNVTNGTVSGIAGGSVLVNASGSVSITGAVLSNGGTATAVAGGAATGGRGGTITVIGGSGVSIAGGVSAAGGSGTSSGGTVTAAYGGGGGSVTISSGGPVVLGSITTTGGNASAGTGSLGMPGNGGGIVVVGSSVTTGTIDAAGGTGQYSSGATATGLAGSVIVTAEDATASALASAAAFAAPVSLAIAPATAGRVLDVGSITGGDIHLNGTDGVIRLRGDLTSGPTDTARPQITLTGRVRLQTGVALRTTGGDDPLGGGITIDGPLDGRYPLVVRAGAGTATFGGVVGGTAPLSGLRFESAGAVEAAGAVHVAGGTAGSLRHGIEIAPAASNVRLVHGGTIRNFATGQAIHVQGGSAGTRMSGFRIENAGRPFIGFGGPDTRPTITGNTVVRPVFRPVTARITAGGGRTNAPEPLVSGTARPGDRVTLYADDEPIGTAVATSDGRFSTRSTPLADGTYRLTVRAVGPGAAASAVSPPVVLAIKTTPPPMPTVGLAARSDTGIRGDMTTSSTRPWLLGTAEPGSVVAVSIDGRLAGRAAVGRDGTWRLNVATPLARGELVRQYAISVTAFDGFGNSSPPAGLDLVIVDRWVRNLV